MAELCLGNGASASGCAEVLPDYYPGVPIYIVQAGEQGLPVFFEDTDYEFYIDLLQQGLRRTKARLHSYVLLDDSVHLLLTPFSKLSITVMFERISRIYHLYLHRKYHCEGIGFDSCLKACTVHPQQFFLKCSRYIESCVLTENHDYYPEQYQWSSYHHNACGRKDSLIQPHSQYLLLGRNRVERYLNYRDMFDRLLSSQEVFSIKRAISQGDLLATTELPFQHSGVSGV